MRRGVQGEKNLELPPLTEHVVTVEMSEPDRIFYGLVRPLPTNIRTCLKIPNVASGVSEMYTVRRNSAQLLICSHCQRCKRNVFASHS